MTETSASLSIAVNQGNPSLNVDFSACGPVLVKNQSCPVYVTFSPADPAQMVDSLVVSSNDLDPKKGDGKVSGKLLGTGK